MMKALKTTGLSILLLFAVLNSVQAQQKKSKAATVKLITIEGAFTSAAGVMKPVSCYCGNGGEIVTAGGRLVNVCFDDTANTGGEQRRIKAKGYYIAKAYTPASGDPCPGGSMKIFKVISFRFLPGNPAKKQ